MGIQLGETGARKCMSDLRLDGDAMYDAPRAVARDACEREPERRKPDRIWERESPDNTSPSREGMVVDDG